MKVYQQESFRGLPSNHPLKSPSPDLKGKNAIGPTMSPHQVSIRKQMSQFTPPNRAKKITYMEYSTLPINTEHHQSSIETNIEKIFEPSGHEKQYSSTHAKGHYNFELPKQLIITAEQRNHNDLISTGKKSTHKRNMTHSYIESSPLYQTHSKSHRQDDLLKTINQKDMIIKELKEMINLMTENGKHLKNSQRTLIQEEYESMKNEVRILTIENQKLAQIIEKMKQKSQKMPGKGQSVDKSQIRSGSKERSRTQENVQKSQRSSQQNLEIFKQYQEKLTKYEQQIDLLKSKLQQKQANYEKDLDEMIKSHKSLALQCKMYETEKEQFSRQNQRLINLLRLKQKQKQTCYANYSYIDKKQYQSQQAPNTKPPSDLVKSESGRLSIQKIKAQYQQNLKQYKQNVYNQVYNMFDTINATLQEINEKVNGIEDKLNEMERFKNSIKSKTTSHLTSLQENQEQTIKKSAIYIEDPPSSERVRQSNTREALSVILEESRRDNQKLQLQLSQLRREVDMWRKNAQEKSEDQDNKTHQEQAYSEEEILSYQQRIKQLENLVDELRQQKQTSEKQITRLQGQAQRIEEQHAIQMNELTDKLKQYEQSMRQQSIPEEPQIDNSLIQQLKTQTQSLKEELESRRQESMRLRQQISEMQAAEQIKEKELLNQIEQFHSTIKQTQENFNQHKKQNQTQKQSLLQEINQISRLNRAQTEEISQLKDHLKISEDKIQNLLEKIRRVQQTLQKSQNHSQQQQRTIQALQKQNEGLKRKIQAESEKYVLEIHKFTSEFENQVKQYIEDIENQKREIQTLKQQNQSYGKEQQKYLKLIEQQKDAASKITKENENNLSRMLVYEKDIQRLQLLIAKLTQQLKQKSELITILQEQRQTLRVTNQKAMESDMKLNNLIKSIVRLKHTFTQGDNLHTIKEHIMCLQQQNETLNSQKTQLIAQLQSSKHQLFQSQNIRIQLQQQTQSLHSKLQLYTRQLESTKNFYQTYLSNTQFNESDESSELIKPITHSSGIQYRASKSSRKSGRNRIHDLIDEEKHKLTNLLEIIDTLQEKRQQQSQGQQVSLETA